jgi:fructose-bisphosphate aldolase class II
MPLVNSMEILAEARKKRYGVLSIPGCNLEMVVGQIMAAEEKSSPLIIVFNQGLMSPKVPIELGLPLIVNAAKRASVPVIAAILEREQSLETVVKAIHLGSSSIMFDSSNLPYEENVERTKEVARIAHAAGACVEAKLGSVAHSSVGPSESSFTDPDMAAEFVKETGVDALAISFGNVYGAYGEEPTLDLDRVKEIYSMVDVPLVMHGGSGLTESDYKQIIESGISKIAYYTAIARGAGEDLRKMMADAGQDAPIYHEIIFRAIDYFYTETKKLIDILGCSGVVR